ncbi:MAG: hypothetical protein IIB44_11345 [Candidatus Marinimicrobia bacterium]|nr:hypothetical protein [Candidatus Neomarinimicrobiota bacterium]
MNLCLKDFQIKLIAIYLVVIVGGLIIPCYGQVNLGESQVTIDSIFKRMEEVFLTIEDYTVKVKITVKMPGFRMPKKKVKLYFKQPDKLKVKAKGFAIVPKSGLATSSENLLKGLNNPHITGLDTLEGNLLWVVEGSLGAGSGDHKTWTFMKDESKRMLMRLWIDLEKGVIPRVETYIDTMKIMTVQSTYGKFGEGFFLPEVTDIQFHIEGDFVEALHRERRGPFGEHEETGDFELGKDFIGSIRMEFNNYKINQGLKDKIFE